METIAKAFRTAFVPNLANLEKTIVDAPLCLIENKPIYIFFVSHIIPKNLSLKEKQSVPIS